MILFGKESVSFPTSHLELIIRVTKLIPQVTTNQNSISAIDHPHPCLEIHGHVLVFYLLEIKLPSAYLVILFIVVRLSDKYSMNRRTFYILICENTIKGHIVITSAP